MCQPHLGHHIQYGVYDERYQLDETIMIYYHK